MAENSDIRDCPRMNSAEREEQAGVRSSFRMIWKDRDKDAPDQDLLLPSLQFI